MSQMIALRNWNSTMPGHVRAGRYSHSCEDYGSTIEELRKSLAGNPID
jgi:hypothetical protein